jgi:hypothetical protein
MKLARRLIAALALLVSAMPAMARRPYPQGCTDFDRGSCRTAQEQQQFQAYGVLPVRRLAQDGVALRRLFILNANYLDVGVLTFFRRGNGTPQVSIQPPGDAAERPPPLTAPVPLALWYEVLAESDAFHRGRRMADFGPQDICLDAWSYILEAADPPRGSTPVRAVRHAVDQCTGPYHPAWLAERALGLFPGCASLIDRLGSDYHALMACAQVRANPAAAEAWLAVHTLNGGRAEDFRTSFAPDAVLDLTEQAAGGNPVDRWQAFTSERSLYLVIRRIDAVAGGHLRVTGILLLETDFDDEGHSRCYRARTTFELARDAAGHMRIVSARVTGFIRA